MGSGVAVALSQTEHLQTAFLFVLLSKLVTQLGCKRDVEGLRQHKEELTSTVSALQPATLPSGHYPQHGPQPDEDPDMSCVIVLKHRLEDTEGADSRNCKCTCSPETQPKEANDQSFVNAEQAQLEGLLKESTRKNSKQCERICTLKTEQAQLQGLLDESVEENSKLGQHIRTLEAKLKEANEAKDSSCRRLKRHEVQSAEQLVAAITEEQKLHDVSKRQVADLQGQLTGSQREKADVEHQLQEAQHARHQLEHGALRQNQIGAVPSGELLQLVMTCYIHASRQILNHSCNALVSTWHMLLSLHTISNLRFLCFVWDGCLVPFVQVVLSDQLERKCTRCLGCMFS